MNHVGSIGSALGNEIISSGQKQSRSVKTVWAAYALVIILCAIFFSVVHAEEMPLNVYAAGILVTAVCLLPSARWYARGQVGLPMFELLCLAYAAQYAFPVFLQLNRINTLSLVVEFTWDETFWTLMLSALGISSFLLGFYMTQHLQLRVKFPKIDLPLQPGARKAYLLVALPLGLLVTFLEVKGLTPGNLSGIAPLVAVLGNQLYIGIVILAHQVYSTNATTVLKLTLYGFVASSSLLGLTTGFLEQALVPLVFLIAVRWQVVRKLPWRWMVVGLLFFIVLDAGKAAYRAQAWYSNSDTNLIDRIGLWWENGTGTIQSVASQGGADAGIVIAQSTLQRLDLLHQFVQIRRLTPDVVPFREGTSYSYLAVGLIPRLFWQDKPIAQQPNVEDDVAYGLLDPSQVGTTMTGLGHLAEAYANFGVVGLILVMALQGIFFSTMNQVLNGPRSEGGRAIYLSLMVFCLNGVGTGAAVVFGALLQNVLGNALILKLFSGSHKHSEVAVENIR